MKPWKQHLRGRLATARNEAVITRPGDPKEGPPSGDIPEDVNQGDPFARPPGCQVGPGRVTSELRGRTPRPLEGTTLSVQTGYARGDARPDSSCSRGLGPRSLSTTITLVTERPAVRGVFLETETLCKKLSKCHRGLQARRARAASVKEEPGGGNPSETLQETYLRWPSLGARRRSPPGGVRGSGFAQGAGAASSGLPRGRSRAQGSVPGLPEGASARAVRAARGAAGNASPGNYARSRRGRSAAEGPRGIGAQRAEVGSAPPGVPPVPTARAVGTCWPRRRSPKPVSVGCRPPPGVEPEPVCLPRLRSRKVRTATARGPALRVLSPTRAPATATPHDPVVPSCLSLSRASCAPVTAPRPSTVRAGPGR